MTYIIQEIIAVVEVGKGIKKPPKKERFVICKLVIIC